MISKQLVTPERYESDSIAPLTSEKLEQAQEIAKDMMESFENDKAQSAMKADILNMMAVPFSVKSLNIKVRFICKLREIKWPSTHLLQCLLQKMAKLVFKFVCKRIRFD